MDVKKNQIHRRTSYKFFKDLFNDYDILNKEEFFDELFKKMDKKWMHGSIKKSAYARESLDLILKGEKKNGCENL